VHIKLYLFVSTFLARKQRSNQGSRKCISIFG